MRAQSERREKLSRAHVGPLWLCAGAPVGRNYPGNPYPYRASSHFLYFVGASLPGASLLLADGQATLFVRPPTPEDALWHGDTPTFDELAAQLGLVVKPNTELRLPPATATLPAPDLATQQAQVEQLGRALGGELDEALADAVIGLRLCHDAAALAELRDAADATVAAHRAGMAVTRPGVAEAVIRAAMEQVFIARDMTTAYGSIVSVRGEVLHNPHHDGVAQADDLLLADVGAETRGGWAGDVTRTWPVSGRMSSTQREIYDVVLRAQRAAVAMCRPGVRYRDVHLRASEVLAAGLVDLGILRGDPAELVADGVHALFFPHGVGHLLGLDVHDMEDLGDRAGYAPGRTRSTQFGLCYLRLDRDLEPGMVVTIEPGFYRVPAILEDAARVEWARDRVDWERLEAFADVHGIRIEDDVLVTDGEPEVLTEALPKDAASIEACVGSGTER